MDEMGDEIIIVAIEILYGGLIQIDFKNTETGQTFAPIVTGKQIGRAHV